MTSYSSTQKYAAEFFGTFALVLVGCGSAVIAGKAIGLLGISFAFGLTVLAMVYAIGPISGCHINPAITVAMVFAGKMDSKDLGGYIAAQVLGAIVASGILFVIMSGVEGWDVSKTGLGQNGFGEESMRGFPLLSALIAEVVFTFLFLLVIFGATSKNSTAGFAGLAIGMALVLIHLVSIPITGTSVNPARSIGPALFSGTEALTQLWVFIVAPTVGGVLAAMTWKNLFNND